MFAVRSNFLGSVLKIARRHFSDSISNSVCVLTPKPKRIVVTLLDASSSLGTNLGLLLKQSPNINELRIYDEDCDIYAMSLALSQIDTHTRVVPFASNALREAITEASVVISTGGCQKKPGQTQAQLFEQNVDNVRNAALFMAEFNPCGIYCVAKPPIEALIPMVTEEYKKTEYYDPRKIIGVTAVASMIANTFIAEQLRRDPAEVLCPIIGGFSPKTTIPIISQTRPPVEYNSNLYEKLQESIANAEEMLLKGGGMSCYSHAAAISRFVNSVALALKGDENCVECAFVAQTGHIGEFLPYMTSIVKLGREGVMSTHMPKINEVEVARLKAALPHILDNIQIGQIFVNGDTSNLNKFKPVRKCDVVLKQKIEEYNRRAGLSRSARN